MKAADPSCRVVLHVDADAFFCQVHRLFIEPQLIQQTAAAAGTAASAAAAPAPAPPPPLAVQQEGEVIAADHAARVLGVTKWMDARAAGALLRPAGGRVVSVFAEPAPEGGGGGRAVSYRPYREASAAMARALKGAAAAFVSSSGGSGGGGGGAAAAAVVVFEKASIDEAFLEPPPPPPTTATATTTAPAAADDDGEENEQHHHHQQQQQQQQNHEAAMRRGRALAEALRAASRRDTGLALSVGVARNKLLAKLASRAAKPDGIFVVWGTEAERALLDATPVGTLPGMGGGVARAVARAAARGGAGGNGNSGGSPSSPSSPVAAAAPAASPLAPPPRLPLETAGDVHRRFGGDPSALASATGIDPQAAARLVAFARGDDGGAPVVDRGPPRSLGAQHTLTPITVLERMLPLALSAATCPGGDVRPLLPPLPPRDSDAWRRAAAEQESGANGGGGGGGGGLRSSGGGGGGGASPSRPAAPAPPWQGPRVGAYTLLRHGAPGSSARLRRVLEGMCGDLLARVLADRRDEGRWPLKLRVGVAALDPNLAARASPGGRSGGSSKDPCGMPVWGPCMGHATRTGAFPPPRLAAAAAPPAAGQAAAARAAAMAAAAAAAAGERSVPVPPALLSAVVGAALSLAEGLLTARCRYGVPVIQLTVAATAFAAEGAGGGARKQQQQQQQQGIGRYLHKAAAGKRTQEEQAEGERDGDGGEDAEGGERPCGSSGGSGGDGGGSGGESDDGEEEEEEDAAAARAGVKRARKSPAKQQQQQQQQQQQAQARQLPVTLLRLPLVKPIVLHPMALPQKPAASQDPSSSSPSSSPPPPPRDVETAVAAAAASTPARARHQPQRPAPFVPPAPPPPPPPAPGIRLTDVLRGLSRPGGGGEGEGGRGDGSGGGDERDLENALAAAGARCVLPRAAI